MSDRPVGGPSDTRWRAQGAATGAAHRKAGLWVSTYGLIWPPLMSVSRRAYRRKCAWSLTTRTAESLVFGLMGKAGAHLRGMNVSRGLWIHAPGRVNLGDDAGARVDL
jgi:hypothetical protein